MKLLNGTELAGYIKARQAREVRRIRQSLHLNPKLAIVVTVEHAASDVYIRLKQRYGEDIGVTVEVHQIDQADVPQVIATLNHDDSVQGIIVQLPLANSSRTQEVCDLVDPGKDVDALGVHAALEPATPTAILWLLAGYGVELTDKKIVLVGRGKLVGAPLERLLLASGYNATSVDDQTPNVPELARNADIIITATGVPKLITPDMLKTGAIVVDAGTASEDGKMVGDVAPEVYDRQDIIITPPKGGVGPLTICALFENVLRVAREQARA